MSIRTGSKIDSRKKIRHDLETSLRFFQTGFECFSSLGSHDDLLWTFKTGAKRLQTLVEDLAEGEALQPVASPAESLDARSLGYATTKEETYTVDHPAVIRWTEFFETRTLQMEIFRKLETQFPAPSVHKAHVVAVWWHQFSDRVPWVLCQAAAMASTNRKRHYLIQTAFEELGMRDVGQIHADLFWQTVEMVGVSETIRKNLVGPVTPGSPLSDLSQALLTCRSDDQIMGLLLGLEIPARENIETVFSSMAYREDLSSTLAAHPFFQLHRQIESEHIRLAVANFTRFCSTDQQKEAFIRGFESGIQFWRKFWDGIGDRIAAESAKC